MEKLTSEQESKTKIENLDPGTECFVEISIDRNEDRSRATDETIKISTVTTRHVRVEQIGEINDDGSVLCMPTNSEIKQLQGEIEELEEDIFAQYPIEVSDYLEENDPDQDYENLSLADLIGYIDFHTLERAWIQDELERYDLVISWERRKANREFIETILGRELEEDELKDILENFNSLIIIVNK